MTAPALAAEPGELLSAARVLCYRSDESMSGRWPRAAALLARQALEQALDEYWESRQAGVTACRSMRPKLVCLPSYLDDELAYSVTHAWVALSTACHIGGYDLDPTLDELEGWMNVVDEFITLTVTSFHE